MEHYCYYIVLIYHLDNISVILPHPVLSLVLRYRSTICYVMIHPEVTRRGSSTLRPDFRLVFGIPCLPL